MKISTLEHAQQLLKSLGAPERLLLHAKLVSQVAQEICQRLEAYGLDIDATQVAIGAFLHDTGKIQHPQELSVSGNQHEQAGQKMLLELGIQAHIAHHCVSHANFDHSSTTEALLVALADKLWKGKRHADLEAIIVKRVSSGLDRPSWDIFIDLDSIFEDIAAAGTQRLLLTQQHSSSD